MSEGVEVYCERSSCFYNDNTKDVCTRKTIKISGIFAECECFKLVPAKHKKVVSLE